MRINDGFLAPYKVVRIDLDKDLTGWRPDKGMMDRFGNEIQDRIYNQRDFDRNLVLEKRTQLVAKKVSDFLKQTNRFDKTIVFCENIDHAERMRQALVNENADLVAENSKYVMRITGDNDEGTNIRHDNTLSRPYKDYGPRDRVDIILTNPPFGGMEEDGIEKNFLAMHQTRETADLFLALIMHLLKHDTGRAAIVLPCEPEDFRHAKKKLHPV